MQEASGTAQVQEMMEAAVKKKGLQAMLDFLALLRTSGITFRIERQTPDALMVTFTSHGKCVEVDFFVGEIGFSYFGQAESGAMSEEVVRSLLSDNWGN
jgi:hypothetical protein